MKTRFRLPAAVLAVVVLIAGLAAGCGGSSSSSSSQGSSTDTSSSGSATARGNAVDRAFVRQMVPHHEMAVQMAKMAKTSGRHSDITSLSDDIVSAQDAEITQLQAIAKQLAVKPAAMPTSGMSQMGGSLTADLKTLGVAMDDSGMSMDMAELDGAKPFDRAFIDMMLPHHQGAIRMARSELATGTDAKLKSIAQGIIAAQTREIREMNSWRKSWYGASSPAGGIPA